MPSKCDRCDGTGIEYAEIDPDAAEICPVCGGCGEVVPYTQYREVMRLLLKAGRRTTVPEIESEYRDFLENLTRALNDAGVPAMPSWPEAIGYLVGQRDRAFTMVRKVLDHLDKHGRIHIEDGELVWIADTIVSDREPWHEYEIRQMVELVRDAGIEQSSSTVCAVCGATSGDETCWNGTRYAEACPLNGTDRAKAR